MRKLFKLSAVDKKFEPLVITAHWEDACNNPATNQPRFQVLKFLSDAQKAGHDVIITSFFTPVHLKELLESNIERGRVGQLDLSGLKYVECITRANLTTRTRAGLKIDVAVDNQDVSIRNIRYIQPVFTNELHRDNTMSPLTISGLYEYCGLPQEIWGQNAPLSPKAP